MLPGPQQPGVGSRLEQSLNRVGDIPGILRVKRPSDLVSLHQRAHVG
jgi:hypothetical protein